MFSFSCFRQTLIKRKKYYFIVLFLSYCLIPVEIILKKKCRDLFAFSINTNLLILVVAFYFVAGSTPLYKSPVFSIPASSPGKQIDKVTNLYVCICIYK